MHGTMSEVDAIVDDYRTICRSFRELDVDFIFEFARCLLNLDIIAMSL